jgi:hypothetical protein
MKTIKLKNRKNNKKIGKGIRSRKMNITKKGGTPTKKSTHAKVVKSIRSTRSSRKLPDTLFLNDNLEGKGHTSDENIQDFIHNKLKKSGPQIVNIPVPPETHAILIDVQVDNKKVKISDWGGQRNIYDYDEEEKERWKTYFSFILHLEEYFKVFFNCPPGINPVEFFKVDKLLYKIAYNEHISRKNETCQGGQGGCSNYIYNWEQKYCDEEQCYDEPINK